jgi:lysophospholipase L1-like esterase
MKVFCFGDSITWGAWDSEGGWTARLRQAVEQHDIEAVPRQFNMVYNCGISSDTSGRLLDRFKFDVDARMLEGSDGLPCFVFSIGTNDSIRDVATIELWVGENDFRQNIKELIKQAKEYSPNIVFLGNLPVDETKTNPYTWDDEIMSFNSDIESYESITKQVCIEDGVDFIEVFSSVAVEEMVGMLSDDGLHPNDK